MAVCILRVWFIGHRMFSGGPVRLGDMTTARLLASMKESFTLAAMEERSSSSTQRHWREGREDTERGRGR